MEKMPFRKQLRLKGYDYSSCGAYFVTICTRNKAKLFGEIEADEKVGATLCGRPQKMISKWLCELENKFLGVKIDEYVVMPDHIHFILWITGDHAGSPLQEMMDWFKTMTTNEYIRGVKEGLYSPFEKSVWQRGYMERVIRNEKELYETRKYILENPLKYFLAHPLVP